MSSIHSIDEFIHSYPDQNPNYHGIVDIGR